MGRVTTWLVVGIASAVLAAAVVDSLRGGGAEEQPQPDEAARALAADVESRAAIANRLRHEGIRGRLLYTDERCTLRAVSLPDLAPAATPGLRNPTCAFSASPDGQRVASPGAAWSADSRRVAVCRGTSVVVSVATERAPVVERHRGCRPAWRPDGVLTLVRHGAVVDTAGRTFVTRAALREAALTLPIAPDVEASVSSEIVDVAWLTSSRVAVLHRVGFSARGRELAERELQVVVFEGGRRVDSTVTVGTAGIRLDASRDGKLVAVRPGMLLGADARTVFPVTGAGTGRAGAVSISPDGRFVALALRGRVSLMSVAGLRAGRFRSVSLPFEARDLAWR